MIWVIGDTHFGHTNLVKHGVRPKGTDDVLLANLRDTPFADGDILVHLGDFCIDSSANCKGWWELFSESIPFFVRTLLVLGNHDTNSISWYIKQGWDMVAHGYYIEYYGKSVYFSHMPSEISGKTINVHGHLHNSKPSRWEPSLLSRISSGHRLYSPELNEYRPVKLQTILRDEKKFSTLERLIELEEK